LFLSYDAICQQAPDPVLRAVLLEQPVLMTAVRALLLEVCALFKQQQQAAAAAAAAAAAGGVDADHQQQQQQQRLASVAGAASGVAPGRPRQGSSTSAVDDTPPCEPVCWDTLERLCSQARLTGGGTWAWPHGAAAAAGGKGAAAAMQQDAGVQGGDNAGGGAVYGGATDEEHLEMLSSLELARAARLAANKAYLQGLGLGPTALQQGAAAPLPPDHTALVRAAQALAKQAAVGRAKRQLAASQRLLDARRRARRSQEVRLRAALNALCADEAAAAAQVDAALAVFEDMQQQTFGAGGAAV
jgi:hypothetical protein